MGAIPTQRETVSLATGASAHPSETSAQVRAELPGTSLAPGAARALVRVALADWTEQALPGTEYLTDRHADDALLVVSELVTNAVVHAGTDVGVAFRLEPTGTLVVEVSDRHPARAPRSTDAESSTETPEYGRGLRLVATVSDAWGITYRTGVKTVWAGLPPDRDAVALTAAEGIEAYAGERGPGLHAVDGDRAPRGPWDSVEQWVRRGTGGTTTPTGPQVTGEASGTGARPETDGTGENGANPGTVAPDSGGQRDVRDRQWLGRGALSFLAEASDLLAGQLDEDRIASLAAQLVVPRLADWCAVWLEDESLGRADWGDGSTSVGVRLARVWHGSEHRIEELRRALEKDPPRPPAPWRSGPVTHPWPGYALGPRGAWGAALAYRLVAGGRPLGTLVIGRAAAVRFPDEITGLVEDLGRRVALAIGTARQYARQATISAVLQRGLLPGAVAEIPGMRSALVYEPRDQGGPSGDFYDLFPAGDGRWCFAVGDVQGKGPEAAVVIGLARPWLRLLAREGYGVADVLDRLNQLLLDDATEAADAAARALVVVGGRPVAPGDGPQTRFLSLLYGTLVPFDGGVHCTLASAGHPLPLLLTPDGDVRTVARPQTLLGVVEDETYTSETFDLRPGDSLLCVTDGVTERRNGSRQFDDDEGLAVALAGCAGLDAQLIAARVRGLVHAFGDGPPEDDLALLVLQAE
ncbi:SpoIIE family protein phosphatase [Streptomyces sp. ISL-12]|uniref:SpoIIE family protein phosphatase n=1 Tax=Streptomyces sp. ISL-12 TaxID=2819177 RepID=UPI001BE6A057|nr:SpoIIE family protein phosphatase [Streptomyces sp. ISL-12]MBT2413187.1 SpoIIE family protein phosphatase [Streptomyces sp. ISL-12]